MDLARAGARADRVLDAPTSDAWLTPWAGHLRGAGVELRLGEAVEGIELRNGRIAGVTVSGGRQVIADFYVAALPVEVMRTLLSPELRAAEPRLNGLDRLVTRWMNGILFYLREDLPLERGHTIYIDSEWALTSISQRQFWRGVDFSRLGDGTVGGILSVDISEWQRPGSAHRQGRRAVHAARRSATRSGRSCATTSTTRLDGVEVRSWFARRGRSSSRTRRAPTNAEPLLVNTAGSWADRPDARPASQPAARRRLRAHLHRPGHDGGRQRGGPPRGQRDPRRDPLLARRAAACGRCASRRRWPRRARSTSCAGSSGARPRARCGSASPARSRPTGVIGRALALAGRLTQAR